MSDHLQWCDVTLNIFVSLCRKTSSVSDLDASENVSQFGTDECAAGVRGVDVQPQRLTITHETDLFQVVERADSRRTERRTHLYYQSRYRQVGAGDSRKFNWSIS